ncbi:MAG: N-acetylmuramoyl-L-alanine amidase [Bacteroidetes bacterium]|nr:N-acetylmuramoyl-L-alanine amidase [Bacteroidota bacterium]
MNKLKRISHLRRVIGIVILFPIVFYSFYTTDDLEKTYVVVLDAGHGGKDPGNLGTGRIKKTEKDVTLDVVLQVGKLIEQNFPDVKVVYTRNADVFPTLKERVLIANRSKADVFISVHCNANANKVAYGSESFVMGLHKTEESLATAMKENASIFLEDNKGQDYDGFDPNNPDTYIALSLRENVFLEQSADLAKNVQDLFRAKLGRKDRGVKQAGYYVISFTNMPSILIELGFLTNAAEEDYLQSTKGKSELSKSIYQAFASYKNAIQVNLTKDEKGVEQDVEEQMEEPAPKPVIEEMIASSQSDEIIWREGSEESGIWFKVQFLSSPQLLKVNAPELKKFSRTEYYLYNAEYRYTAGKTMSFEEAKANMRKVHALGFKDAFVVAFENGKRIDLKDAIKRAK